MTNPILIDHAELRRRGVKLHNSTLLKLEAKGKFPKRVRIGVNVYWVAEEIDEFIRELQAAR